MEIEVVWEKLYFIVFIFSVKWIIGGREFFKV